MPTATASPPGGRGAVEAACAEALLAGIASGDVILAVLARQRQARSISWRIGGARLPVLQDLDKCVFADNPARRRRDAPARHRCLP